jgi:hypothetical protein
MRLKAVFLLFALACAVKPLVLAWSEPSVKAIPLRMIELWVGLICGGGL